MSAPILLLEVAGAFSLSGAIMPLRDRTYYSERIPDYTAPPRGSSTRARATVDVESQAFGSLLTAAVVGPIAADDDWSSLALDSRSLARMSPPRLLELL